ncbi:hypothetical protein [Clostridium butyricum]|uniref:hypothetical protein n=1 Tax=Clostridium butyricum TaxID=1492 RepID=UPI0013D6A93F|nr:hypothetical protein [Clostridium butyricum]MCQ2017652.1 hypothetical protein [Clostridium butyricum]MCQ2022644.1 hypothetical protein [Clostridium butyricum]MCQ2027548.1 hypothetical protein [Clostridium butyricum]MDU1507707.1 hypothetical protein [Clostridium butyricum]NFB73022.1 hypothetical protein [Clostridium butyricum]
MHDKEKKALIELIVPRVIKIIMNDQRVSEEEAFTILYSSKLYSQLDNEKTKLWHLSVLTLYEMLCEEQNTGKITYPEEA